MSRTKNANKNKECCRQEGNRLIDTTFLNALREELGMSLTIKGSTYKSCILRLASPFVFALVVHIIFEQWIHLGKSFDLLSFRIPKHDASDKRIIMELKIKINPTDNRCKVLITNNC